MILKSFVIKLTSLIKNSSTSAITLRSSLTDILMAQDFQDLTGQMIRRVIDLVQEIESKLVGILTVCQCDEILKSKNHEIST